LRGSGERVVVMRRWERWLVGATLVSFVVMVACLSHCETVDKKLLVGISFEAASVAADGYTTQKCNGRELSEPWMYGTYPGRRHMSLVMAGEFLVVSGAEYWLKRRGSRFWMLPMVNSVGHVRGVIHNLEACK
jgi:hypothetical protein